MLIVKIELHSAVTGQVTTIATGSIVNTGTGSPTQGNYRIELRDAAGRKWKSGHIEGFPRKRLLAWDLLCRALEKCVGKRNERVEFSVPSATYLVGHEPNNTTQKEPSNDRATAQSGHDSEVPRDSAEVLAGDARPG
jgi:hypothetical protein